MPAGWTKYGVQDDREINTLRGNLNDVQNKLLSIKNVENPVNSDERDRILKIEEGMKNMFVIGKNAIGDLYSKFDNRGDFSNKSKFRNPVKEEQKTQSQKIYIERENPMNVEKPKPKSSTSEYRNSYYENVTKPIKKAAKFKKSMGEHYDKNSSNVSDKDSKPFIETEKTFL